MESFDITIEIEDKEVSLTLQPEKAKVYKVIYHGMMVGEITDAEQEGSWQALPVEALRPGIYPMYEHDAAKGTPRIVLDKSTLQKISDAIEK
jgi:hypothetical protein